MSQVPERNEVGLGLPVFENTLAPRLQACNSASSDELPDKVEECLHVFRAGYLSSTSLDLRALCQMIQIDFHKFQSNWRSRMPMQDWNSVIRTALEPADQVVVHRLAEEFSKRWREIFHVAELRLATGPSLKKEQSSQLAAQYGLRLADASQHLRPPPKGKVRRK